MLFDKGKLEKLTLRPVKVGKGNEPPQVSEKPDEWYVAQVNPSSYSLNHLITYTYQRGQGFSKSEAVFNDAPPINLNFEFLFDGTGVVPPAADIGDIPLVGALASALSQPKPFVVMDEIRKFNRLVYDYDSDKHRPRQLLLVWGTLVFSCVLSSVTYRFTLFNPDGTPLRAVASCSFCESIPKKLKELLENPLSPDLTHLREVRDGDTLPAMAHAIYGKPELYLQVAQANRLVNFRRLRQASRVEFPPLATQAKS